MELDGRCRTAREAAEQEQPVVQEAGQESGQEQPAVQESGQEQRPQEW